MEDVSEQTSRMFQIHKTVCKLLDDRGFDVPTELSGLSAQGFKERFNVHNRSSLQIKVWEKGRPQTPGTAMLVYFTNDDKLGASGVQDFFAQVDAEGARKAILVFRKTMTPFAKKGIPEEVRQRHQASKPVDVCMFSENELVVNITDHELVPRHTVMTAKQKQELLAKYHVTEAQLPRILVTDPVARYYGLKRGQCVRIERKSDTAGRYISYRICV